MAATLTMDGFAFQSKPVNGNCVFLIKLSCTANFKLPPSGVHTVPVCLLLTFRLYGKRFVPVVNEMEWSFSLESFREKVRLPELPGYHNLVPKVADIRSPIFLVHVQTIVQVLANVNIKTNL